MPRQWRRDDRAEGLGWHFSGAVGFRRLPEFRVRLAEQVLQGRGELRTPLIGEEGRSGTRAVL